MDDEKFDANEIPTKNIAMEKNNESLETQCWSKPSDVEDKSREEEFDEYLEDLLL